MFKMPVLFSSVRLRIRQYVLSMCFSCSSKAWLSVRPLVAYVIAVKNPDVSVIMCRLKSLFILGNYGRRLPLPRLGRRQLHLTLVSFNRISSLCVPRFLVRLGIGIFMGLLFRMLSD